MPIGAAIGAAAVGSTISQIHGTRSAAKQNRRAIEATERGDTRAADLEGERLALDREDAARRERLYTDALQRDKERWQDYLRINEPHWRQGSSVLGNLYDIAGIGPAPAYAAPTPPSEGLEGARPTDDGRLPEGVPPGSVPVNGGINPNAAAYQTPDGRIIRRRRQPMPTMPIQSRQSSMPSLLQLAQLAGSGRPSPAAPAPYQATGD